MLRFPSSMLDNNLESLFYPDVFQRARRSAGSAFPAVNIGTTDKSVDVYYFVSGIKAEDLELVIE